MRLTPASAGRNCHHHARSLRSLLIYPDLPASRSYKKAFHRLTVQHGSTNPCPFRDRTGSGEKSPLQDEDVEVRPLGSSWVYTVV
jgi:hypothetical protein